MTVDYLIIGQGICGSLLSWFLHKEGKTFVVIDNNDASTSSKVAAGIINPITGRRYVTTWMIEEVMPFAVQTYKEMSVYFDTNIVSQKSIIDFFPSAQMRNAFVERIEEDDTYLHAYPDQNHFNPIFHYDFGCGAITPAYIVAIQTLLEKWRQRLTSFNALVEQEFTIEDVQVKDDGIVYGDIAADKIIFCDGAAAAQNPWFQLLPFAPNKGEALLISCPGLERDHIFKKGMILAPMATENRFWVGSNYQWEFADAQPSQAFFDQASTLLKHWLKLPFEVLSHGAAVRPATLERRPFVGFHPVHQNIGILNGMGTKGSSLGPYFANQFCQHLVHGLPISPEADVHRFNRILSK